jgi:rhamnosyltransferase
MEGISLHDKIATVVILYNPSEHLHSNINTYYAYSNRIYIIDNSIKPLKFSDWSAYSKIEYFHDGRNKGLATALNIAASKAVQDGYDWLLTMDQDSSFEQHSIENYYQCFLRFPGKDKVALFGPDFNKPDPGRPTSCSWKETDILITSGTLLNLSLFDKIGRFDEALFIDSVDHDYCIRAKLAGYSLIQFTSVIMQHELGTLVERSSIKTLFLIKKKKELHAPSRCYYMFRNMLYLKAKFNGYNLPVLKVIKDDVYDRINKYLFYGRNSLTLLKYLLKAYRDYKGKRMGEITKI